MKKRNVGERAEILFDDIDRVILNLIFGSSDGIGVLDLANSLNLKHKNLKPHIDKLMHLKLLFANKNNEGKVILRKSGAEELEEQDFDTTREYEDCLKAIAEQKALIRYLNEVQNYFQKRETNKLLDIDLRKLKREKK